MVGHSQGPCEGGEGQYLILVLWRRKLGLLMRETHKWSQNSNTPLPSTATPPRAYFYLVLVADFFLSLEA